MKNLLTAELLIKHIEDKVFSIKKQQHAPGYFAYCNNISTENTICNKCPYSYEANSCYTARFFIDNDFILEHFPEEII